MPDKPFKVMDRRVSKMVGGRRNPLSGGASLHTRGDIIHPTLYIECKCHKLMATLHWMREAEVYAKKEGKIPIVALHSKGKKGDYFLIKADADHIYELSRSMEMAK